MCVHLQYDPENSGFISTERFRDLLATHGSELDPHKLEVLLALADGNADGKICYQDFVNLVRYLNTSTNERTKHKVYLQDFVPNFGLQIQDLRLTCWLAKQCLWHTSWKTLSTLCFFVTLQTFLHFSSIPKKHYSEITSATRWESPW